MGSTNEIWKLDPIEKAFSLLLFPAGSLPPPPQHECTVARLGSETAFVLCVHGRTPYALSPFLYRLDMRTLRWSEIGNADLSYSILGHSLSVISPSQLLLVGGDDFDKVLVFDADNSSWTVAQHLPAEIGDVYRHRAVEVWKDGRVAKVVCLGGWNSVPDPERPTAIRVKHTARQRGICVPQMV